MITALRVWPCVALLSTLSAGAGAGRTLHPLHLRLRHLLPHALQAAGGRGARRLRGAARRQDEHGGGGGGQRQVRTRRRRKCEDGDLWGSRVGRRLVRRSSVPACLYLTAHIPHSVLIFRRPVGGGVSALCPCQDTVLWQHTDASVSISTPSSSGLCRSLKNLTLPEVLRAKLLPTVVPLVV